MAAYFAEDLWGFVHLKADLIVARLHVKYAEDGFSSQYTSQTEAWNESVPLLQNVLRELLDICPDSAKWRVLLEFPLYRLRRRIDVLLVSSSAIFVIELKVGEAQFRSADRRQVEEYALDLRDFHSESSRVTLVPLLWCTDAEANQYSKNIEPSAISEVLCVGRTGVAGSLERIAKASSGNFYEVGEWEVGQYRPVPTIIDAATTLFAGHGVREIAKADASNLDLSARCVVEIVERTKKNRERALIFLAGVPGSGKTLAGLQVVHSAVESGVEDRGDIVYLSGNTPLVVVLREALARDEAARQKARGDRSGLTEARNAVRTRIQHIIDFLREYLTSDSGLAPHEHVIVFDEAQRAWDEEYGRKKFGRPSSEPRLLLDIMGRHPDWCVIVALVGGGQEINVGENGIAEWGKALRALPSSNGKQWNVYGPPGFLIGSEATAHLGVGDLDCAGAITFETDLELTVPLRSFRSPLLSKWVSLVLEGNAAAASEVFQSLGDYPVVITRSIDSAREWLKDSARGERRFGLVASSGARRLRADGFGEILNATDGSAIAQWYLNDRGDVRSSFALEVPANEYTTQGLELDFAGLCWGGDLVWEGKAWKFRQFRGNSWTNVGIEGRRFVANSYRVLMTRAREGLVIWVPRGCLDDPTRAPMILDETAAFLLACGAAALPD